MDFKMIVCCVCVCANGPTKSTKFYAKKNTYFGIGRHSGQPLALSRFRCNGPVIGSNKRQKYYDLCGEPNFLFVFIVVRGSLNTISVMSRLFHASNASVVKSSDPVHFFTAQLSQYLIS